MKKYVLLIFMSFCTLEVDAMLEISSSTTHELQRIMGQYENEPDKEVVELTCEDMRPPQLTEWGSSNVVSGPAVYERRFHVLPFLSFNVIANWREKVCKHASTLDEGTLEEKVLKAFKEIPLEGLVLAVGSSEEDIYKIIPSFMKSERSTFDPCIEIKPITNNMCYIRETIKPEHPGFRMWYLGKFTPWNYKATYCIQVPYASFIVLFEKLCEKEKNKVSLDDGGKSNDAYLALEDWVRTGSIKVVDNMNSFLEKEETQKLRDTHHFFYFHTNSYSRITNPNQSVGIIEQKIFTCQCKAR